MKDCIADPCPCRLIVQMTSKYGWSECEQIQFLTSSILEKKDKKKLLSVLYVFEYLRWRADRDRSIISRTQGQIEYLQLYRTNRRTSTGTNIGSF